MERTLGKERVEGGERIRGREVGVDEVELSKTASVKRWARKCLTEMFRRKTEVR
jgi:hypothetical protein